MAGIHRILVIIILGAALQSLATQHRPAIVSVQYIGHHRCFGSVVFAQYIYLPAQCVYNMKVHALSVQFGFTNLGETETRRVVDLRLNPKWSPTSPRGPWGYDDALIKMESPFTTDLQPDILAGQGSVFPTGTKGIVYGLAYFGQGPIPKHRALQGFNVTVTDHELCKRIYKEMIDDNMICAIASVAGGPDACTGDAGAVLMVQQGDDQIVAGFVVRAPGPCGAPNMPTVYWTPTSSEKFVTSALEEMRDPLPHCGIRDKPSGVRDSGRIENVQVAAPHSWPWMVAIVTADGSHRMDAVLINQLFVATSFNVRPGDLVLLGIHNLSSTTENTQRILVEQVFKHPNSTGYSMVLAKLKSPVKFNKNVKPVCVPKAGDSLPVGKTCMVTGWRAWSLDGYPGPGYTDLLHEAPATIITHDQCRRDAPSDWPGNPDFWIHNTMFCTAGSESFPYIRADGGPLMCENDDASWTLYGIYSPGQPSSLLQEI